MDSRKIVFQQTAVVAIGEIICVAAMFGVFALLNRFDRSVLLGGILGGFLTVADFFFMAIGTSLAADKAESQDVKGGQNTIRTSYLLRHLILIVILFAAAKSSFFNIFALVIPLVFIRPILMVGEFFRKSGENKT